MSSFFAYVATQFGVNIQGIQCDNGNKFDNHSARTFFHSNDIKLRMSCPYTLPQMVKLKVCFAPSIMLFAP
jgi:hypothetical protein